MNLDEFKHLLTIIIKSKNSDEKCQAEKQYENLRLQQPSDMFINLLLQIVKDNTDQELNQCANVLLLDDIKKGIQDSAIYKISTPDLLPEIMTDLLNVLASTQNEKLAQTVAIFFSQQLKRDNIFQPILDFLQQGLLPENKVAHKMCLTLMHNIMMKLTSFDYQKLNVDFIPIVGQFFNHEDNENVLISIRIIYAILSWYDSDDGKHSLNIPKDVQQQLLSKSIEKITSAYQAGVDVKLLVDTISDLMDVFENSEIVVASFDYMLKFMIYMLNNQQEERIYKVIILLFQNIINTNNNIKKKHRDHIMTFIYQYVFPKCADTDDEIEMPSVKMLSVDSDSLQETAIYCITDVSAIIGQNIIVPVIDKILREASGQNIHYIDATINIIKGAAEGIEIDIKEKQVIEWTNFILTCIQTGQLILQRDGLDALQSMSECLAPRIQNMHEKVLPVLKSLYENQISPVISSIIPKVFIKYIEKMECKYIQRYLQFLYDLAKKYLGENILEFSIYGVQLLSNIIEKSDYEDITGMMVEILPYIKQQFQCILDKIFNQNDDFIADEVTFINTIIHIISLTIAYSPQSYESDIEEIINRIYIIISKALSQDQSELFETATDALNKICESKADLVIQYFMENRQLYYNILKDQQQQLQKNQQLSKDTIHLFSEQVRTQELILDLINEMIEKKPSTFVQIYDELKQLLPKQYIYTSDRILYLVGNLQQVLLYDNQRSDREQESEYLMQYFLQFLKSQLQELVNDDSNLAVYFNDDEQFYIALNVANYAKYFTKYQKDVIQNIEDSQYIETINTLFDAMKTLLEYSIKYTNTNENNIDQQFEDEEADGQIENVKIAQQDILQNIANVFLYPIEVLGAVTPEWMLKAASDLITTLIKNQNASKRQKATRISQNHYGSCALGFIAKIAHNLSAEIVMNIYNTYVQDMKKLFKQLSKNDIFIRNHYCCLKQVVACTGSAEVASDSIWNGKIQQILSMLKQDGSENALSAYDNVVCYLVVSAFVLKAPPAHWKQIFDFAMQMEEDMDEIVYILNLLLDHKHEEPLASLQEQIFQLSVQLFFGVQFSMLRHENKMITAKCTQYFAQDIPKLHSFIEQSNVLLQKNFNTWATELQRQ